MEMSVPSGTLSLDHGHTYTDTESLKPDIEEEVIRASTDIKEEDIRASAMHTSYYALLILSVLSSVGCVTLNFWMYNLLFWCCHFLTVWCSSRRGFAVLFSFVVCVCSFGHLILTPGCFQDDVQKLLEIQRSLIGQFEVIQPGRVSSLAFISPI